ncbi:MULTISPECIES: nucleoid occlusion protein [Thermoactinomyces]|uniref:Nucleoid occlusion protein n=1 Tax=Thermoactinomyces vulgaris TaxID=2026 RepID=A0ABS0QFI2_THEVU|nr:nucleoid occlusion protein [Thermoactinomyces vulgaris]MBI0387112.1 nucleoid occlusion protein [Thermoactinomyces sp. CICC 24227]MBI0392246.1 nucleoid occlusion protein [Thermoactinomyces sp. CICC 24226]MBA4551148.1 nucleoid occlusion protein [Thermoactinomyces vulgaris]MBA4596893.1 nucleoid occlusion protein [Thermoactinomyces vulgaris]MBH8588035.1 nucleoid occlusion protein [Thermoactinomyces vulgaris]
MSMRQSFTRLFGLKEKEQEQEVHPDQVMQIPVNEIEPSPYQPRTIFDEERIDELCQTIRMHGVIQPVVVRRTERCYELVAGERRLRAVKKLGLDRIPAVIREMDDHQAAAASLIENLQREELTAIEEAHAYQRLMEVHQLTQEGLAQKLGKGQSTIANKLRLLQLPAEVQEALQKRMITERHARALLPLKEGFLQQQVLEEILAKGWNVKQTEERVKKLLVKETNKQQAKRKSVTRDFRIAMNTIRQSVDLVKKTGMDVMVDEREHENFVEVIIRLPK